jgi:beta-phosphoglucomutase-like phosphatase (HAD superfamily)
MIEAVIFDMDGVLIDSEPMWKKAEKHVFSSVGVDVNLAFSNRTASMTTSEVTKFWYQHYPWKGKSVAQVENEVIDYVEALILKEGTQMEGVKELLDFFQNRKLKIGLSTNSPARLISVILNKLNIAEYFQAISSSEHEQKGKPDPAVYLSTARKLNVHPSKCIAFEDSVSGIIAAKKANVKVIAVPAAEEFFENKFEISHMKIRRLSEFTDDHLKTIVKCD